MGLPRHAELWAPGLVRSWLRDRSWRPPSGESPICWLLFTDHFEPYGGPATDDVARERMSWWNREWPRIADRHRDAFDRKPRFTFFYPAEEYQPWVLDDLQGRGSGPPVPITTRNLGTPGYSRKIIQPGVFDDDPR